MISIKDTKAVILDAMRRSHKGSDVYNTYKAVYDMLTSLSDEFDANLEVDNLLNELNLN